MIRLALLALAFTTCSTLFAQDVSGRWEGILDQSEEAFKDPGYHTYWRDGLWVKGKQTHDLVLTFTQSGDDFTGEYFIVTYNLPEHNATFSLHGTIKDNELTYETDSILEENRFKNFRFCHNKARLTYSVDGNYEILEGTWEGWLTPDHPCAGAVVRVARERQVEPTAAESQDSEFHEREVIVKDRFTAAADAVKLRIWDNHQEDGDTITLKLNGKTVLEHHRVTKKPEVITLHLEPGENHLVVYAENLGTIKPNTAAIAVIDGETEQSIVLHSDMGKSESLVLRRE